MVLTLEAPLIKLLSRRGAGLSGKCVLWCDQDANQGRQRRAPGCGVKDASMLTLHVSLEGLFLNPGFNLILSVHLSTLDAPDLKRTK